MKYLVIAVFVGGFALPTPAQRYATTPEAVAVFKALATKRMTSRQEMGARNEAVGEWLRDVDGMELGEFGFTRAIARYFAHDYDGAVEGLLAHLKAHGAFPVADYNTMIGRVFMNGIVAGARNGDFSRTEELMQLALSYYPKRGRRGVYTMAAGQLQRAGDEHRAMLVRVMTALLNDPILSDADKIAALRGIFRPRTSPARESGPKPLKPFHAIALDGAEIALTSYQGNVVLVDFWATWCGPCLREMPTVVAAYRKHRAKGFEVIGISLDKAGETRKIQETCKKLGMTWPQIYEGKGWDCSLAKANGVRSIPATWLIDRQGKVRYTNLRGPALARRIGELLAEPATKRRNLQR